MRVLQHVAIQESRNKRNQAPSAPDVRAQRILGNPRGQGGAAETTYHSIRTINSIHINFCYKSYKGGCFWVFRSTFYFKAVYSVFINCPSPWWLPSCVAVAQRPTPSSLSDFLWQVFAFDIICRKCPEFLQEWPRCSGKMPPSFDGVDEMNLLGWARAVPCVWGMDQVRTLRFRKR